MGRTKLFSLFCIALAVSMPECAAAATTLTFEGIAPSGGYDDLSNEVYVESGFSVHPGLQIVDSQAPLKMAGNNSDWFAFNNGFSIRPAPFQLFSVISLTFAPVADPVSGVAIPAKFNWHADSLTGTMGGQSVLVNTATVYPFNLHKIYSLSISPISAGSTPGIFGIDNVVLTPEGDSQTLLICGLGLGLIATRRRRMAQFLFLDRASL